jgi:hypothetical protein
VLAITQRLSAALTPTAHHSLPQYVTFVDGQRFPQTYEGEVQTEGLVNFVQSVANASVAQLSLAADALSLLQTSPRCVIAVGAWPKGARLIMIRTDALLMRRARHSPATAPQ